MNISIVIKKVCQSFSVYPTGVTAYLQFVTNYWMTSSMQQAEFYK